MSRIIAIANQKGGVGKTTTAINLGTALAERGQKVLVVDCDPQGNASSGFGTHLGSNDPGLLQFMFEENQPAPIVTPLADLPLSLLPANSHLVAAEFKLLSHDQRETLLRERLDGLRSAYAYILLDCPPSLGLLTVNALNAAHSVLIPLQCEYFALEGLSLLLDTIRRIKIRLNPSLLIEGVLLTMFDRRNNLSHQVANEIRGHLRFNVFKTMVPRNVRLSECPSHGLPVLLYDAQCLGSKAYLALADEILFKDRQVQGH
jgi:chromosome partitioning protein